jgi:hypothetical protein
MTKRIMVLALLGGLAAALAGGTHAQDKSAPPPAKVHRTLYAVKNADAGALADVLGKHFKGEAEVLAAPAGSGNALLISGTPAAAEEVVKLLAELDRKPKMVEVEVTIAEVPAKKADAKDKAAPAPDVDLSGPDVLAKLEAMGKAGQLGPVQRIKLTAVEGQPVSTTTGGNKPYTSSGVVAGGGPGGGFGGGGPGGARPAMRSVNYQAVGTTVRMTARVGAGDTVAVDLNLQDSQVKPPEAGDESGAPSFDNNTLVTKLSVPPGRAVVAQAVRADGKSGRTVALVVVTARVADPVAEANKQ